MADHVINAFSVDVEDYYQVLNFQRSIKYEDWPRFESRVEANTMRILELLERHAVRGTFFCLGWVAEHCPELIRRIAQAGHELASHGWSHRPVTALQPNEFRDEVRRTKRLLEDIAQQLVVGYRAPSFSILPKTLWAHDILLEEGYAYDSSVFPVRHPDYGIPGAPEELHLMTTPKGRSILEVPMTVAHAFGKAVPVSGGGYLRLLPLWVTQWGWRQVNRQGRPAILYLHPWEVDPDQPNLRKYASRLGAFRHYTGLKSTLPRLERLLGEFRFAPLVDVIRHSGYSASLIVDGGSSMAT